MTITDFLNRQRNNDVVQGLRKYRAYDYETRRRRADEKWSVKGCMCRRFGRGADQFFATLPARKDVAVTGSVAVALYDMYLHKRDVDWLPNDLDVFVAVPYKERAFPLAKAFPVMNHWLDKAEKAGFLYQLAPKGCIFGHTMCIFDFVCTNPLTFPTITFPKVSFVVKCASSVREICDGFDLPICGAILLHGRRHAYRISITPEMYPMYVHHATYSRFMTLDVRTLLRMIKYQERGFEIMQMPPPDSTFGRTPDDLFPKVDYYRSRTEEPVPAWFIEDILGRFPTEQEARRFRIDLNQHTKPDNFTRFDEPDE